MRTEQGEPITPEMLEALVAEAEDYEQAPPRLAPIMRSLAHGVEQSERRVARIRKLVNADQLKSAVMSTDRSRRRYGDRLAFWKDQVREAEGEVWW